MKLRIGSRDSALAVIQAELLLSAMKAAHPDLELELITMKTTGDRILDRTLDKVGGKGLFVKELDAALLEGRVDITVHSCKDLPMEENPALPLVAFSRREDPRDVLVLPNGVKEIDFTKPIGCSSLRRTLQLGKLYPQATVQPIRGNLQTRLRKLDEGQFSALVLAAAGLKRLGLEGRIHRWFSPEELLPAAGQGILAVQMRAGEDAAYVRCFDDPAAHACALAERAFVRALDGGCTSPVAAYATFDNDYLTLTGMNAAGVRGVLSGPAGEAEALGTALATRLAAEGGNEL